MSSSKLVDQRALNDVLHLGGLALQEQRPGGETQRTVHLMHFALSRTCLRRLGDFDLVCCWHSGGCFGKAIMSTGWLLVGFVHFVVF